MLEDLLRGAEKSRLVLVTDDTECPGRHLLMNWLHHLGGRCDKLILVCTERSAGFFVEWLPADIQRKITVIDDKSAPSNMGRDMLESAANVVSQAGEAVGVVIDSLSLHLVLKSTPVICSSLHKLATGSQVVQVVALLHRDVHEQSVCHLVEHVASTVVELMSVSSSKHMCCVRHCRPAGRVFRSREYFITNDSFHIEDFGTTPVVGKSSHIIVPQGDVTTELPFNLSLTDAEKDARSKVRLPYVKDGIVDSESPAGHIFYQPDRVDDFDEEDPDDDLNI